MGPLRAALRGRGVPWPIRSPSASPVSAGTGVLAATPVRPAPPVPGAARAFHATLPGYRPTPLVGLPGLAASLGVAQVWVKDEADRFGLPAFKILGASWAVNRALSARAGHLAPAGSLDELRRRMAGSAVTLVTATDGNHGRAVARMARLVGVRARVYLPDGVGSGAVDAIADEGAEVVRTSLVYDQVVQTAARSVDGRPDDVLVQDTSWPGYEDIPRWIVDGYSTLFAEIDDQIDADRPTSRARVAHRRGIAAAGRPAALPVPRTGGPAGRTRGRAGHAPPASPRRSPPDGRSPSTPRRPPRWPA